jgi:Flp pilus assembly protein TadG
MFRSFLKRYREAASHRGGNVAIMFAFALIPIFGLAGAATDYFLLTNLRKRMQTAADYGALQAAKELRLAQIGTSNNITTLATAYAQPQLAQLTNYLSNIAVNTSLSTDKSAVTVSVTANYQPQVARLIFNHPLTLAATATAQTVGYPVCALTLDPAASQAIYLRTQAQVTAQFCAVQSNSNSSTGIYTQGSSQMTAGTICSSGGAKGKFTPAPITDCPTLPDPLASRVPPTVGTCSYNNEVVNGGTVTLLPGNYCGGLYVTGGAIVTLSPGVYIMSGGPLKVDAASTLTGSGAGVYLTGTGALLWFGQDTTISMTAPTNGPLAGLLFYEDPTVPAGQVHYVYSDNAPVLLGTIYLPKNQLYVETNKDVSKASDFTIIVANSLFVSKASNLWLNSNYNGSSGVPVPGGMNPGYTRLSQ